MQRSVSSKRDVIYPRLDIYHKKMQYPFSSSFYFGNIFTYVYPKTCWYAGHFCCMKIPVCFQKTFIVEDRDEALNILLTWLLAGAFHRITQSFLSAEFNFLAFPFLLQPQNHSPWEQGTPRISMSGGRKNS